MTGRIARGVQEAWYAGAWWLVPLVPLGCLYGALARLRRRTSAGGATLLPLPVVVVGNITVGGTGKTPVVIALVEALRERGLRAGVVSRGYGAKEGPFPHRLRHDSRPEQCGDEALEVFYRTGCPCAVAPDRVAAAQQLCDEVDVLISDDGLQHYALGRDMEIVLYDEDLGFGNGRCLPAGPLREPLSRLADADFVLARGAGDKAVISYHSDALVNIETGERRPATPEETGRAVCAVAGIAHPANFLRQLQALGFEPSPHPFPDHHDYVSGDFDACGDRPIIMTAKDAVKCRGLAGPNAWYLQVSARLPAALVDSVAALVSR